MKQFSVDVDITMSKRVYVEAETEEEAMELVDGLIDCNPYGYTSELDCYVGHKVICANEVDE